MLNPIVLGKDDKLRRKLPVEATRETILSDPGVYDSETLLYDIFLCKHRKVIAIGPPPINMEKLLLNSKLTIDNKNFSFKKDIISEKIITLSLELPENIDFPVNAVFSAPGIERIITLDMPIRASGSALIAIQKNNRIEWIQDWIEHYRREFGVENFYIYDNGSTYETPLQDHLGSDAVVIDWPFPYGLQFSHKTKFSQAGALNHFKLKHAQNCQIFNFDVDELLTCNQNTKEKLHTEEYMRFDSCWVPVDKNIIESSFSFSDFQYRCTEFRRSAFKYVVNSEIEGVMSVHTFKRTKSVLDRFRRDKTKIPPTAHDKGYFLHYRGINNGWKKNTISRVLGEDVTYNEVIEIDFL